MKKIAIMDTSIMSFNIGDQIIMESAITGLMPVIKDAFLVRMPTHSPLFHKYEFSLRGKDSFITALQSFDYKFVCGTNLLEKNMMKRKNSWNLHTSDLRYFNDFILVGVGTDKLSSIANTYTRHFYDKALNHNFVHSTRDDRTKEMLESLGFKAINTGCATIWPLTDSHCKSIPENQKDEVICTITDYCEDSARDLEMLLILKECYNKVFLWPQGIADELYFRKLCNLDDRIADSIDVLSPTLQCYDSFLSDHDCDYVGTRLHAGIKAMQKGRRSIIIAVDNRSIDMRESYGLPVIEREKISEHLMRYINSGFETRININEDGITTFLNQFK